MWVFFLQEGGPVLLTHQFVKLYIPKNVVYTVLYFSLFWFQQQIKKTVVFVYCNGLCTEHNLSPTAPESNTVATYC